MVQWTPLVAGMFVFRMVLFFLGMVWLRHMIVSMVIFLRNINVERENDGLYRLTTYVGGMQTSVLLHGETQGELLKSFEEESVSSEDSNASTTENVCQADWQDAGRTLLNPAKSTQTIARFIASSLHPTPC